MGDGEETEQGTECPLYFVLFNILDYNYANCFSGKIYNFVFLFFKNIIMLNYQGFSNNEYVF